MPSIDASSVILPVVFCMGNMNRSFNLQGVHDTDKPRIAAMQKKEAVDEILSWQETNLPKTDGYILYLDNVYQVYHSSKQHKKISGPDVKPIKKRLQALVAAN